MHTELHFVLLSRDRMNGTNLKQAEVYKNLIFGEVAFGINWAKSQGYIFWFGGFSPSKEQC